jgi:hypothetical protein
MGKGKFYRGYDVSAGTTVNDHYVWIGFISPEEWFKESDNSYDESELVIVTNAALIECKNMPPIELKRRFLPDKRWGWNGDWGFAYHIKLDPTWGKIEQWKAEIQPVIDELRSGAISTQDKKAS